MLLTVHAATGVLIGQKVKYWWLAFIIAFIVHFIMDIIPHGDHKMIENYRTKKSRQIIESIVIDSIICFGFSLFWLIKSAYSAQTFIIMAAAIFGSVLPDMLVGIHELKPKLLKYFNKVHFFFHDLIPTKKIGLISGLVIQVGVLVFLLTLYNF